MQLTVVTVLMIAALICFAIPALRALFDRSFDYTNSGLALFMLAMLLVGRA